MSDYDLLDNTIVQAASLATRGVARLLKAWEKHPMSGDKRDHILRAREHLAESQELITKALEMNREVAARREAP